LNVNGTTYAPTSYTQADSNKTLVLKFADNVIPQNVTGVKLSTVANNTQDGFGNKIQTITDATVQDGIVPTTSGGTITKDGDIFTVTVTASEALKLNLAYDAPYRNALFTLNVGNAKATITGVEITDSVAGNGDKKVIKVTATYTGETAGKVVQLKFDGAKNKAAEAITDEHDNALDAFTVGQQF
jgi:hypothetical protein